MSWNDERVETLKKLWAQGLSASTIAGELGGITRNAVIGKVHRLGLAGRAKSPAAGTQRPRKPRAAASMLRIPRASVRGNTALAAAYEFDVEVELEVADNVIPLGQRRSLLELTEETCHWPIGDPGTADFYFCGGATVTSLPYCAYHSRIAYQPPNIRRDRRLLRG
jgi:GcrA cell cycle regulator